MKIGILLLLLITSFTAHAQKGGEIKRFDLAKGKSKLPQNGVWEFYSFKDELE